MPVKVSVALLFCAASVLLNPIWTLAQYNPIAEVPDLWKSGFDSITETESEELVTILAGEHFAGRGTGQEGYVKAAFFVAGKLAEYGFEPVGDNGGYFQNLPFARIGPNLEASSLTIGEKRISGEHNIGFVTFTAAQVVTGKVVFVNAKGDNLNIGDKSQYKDRIVVLNADNTGLSFLRPLLQSDPAAIIQVVDSKPENRTRVTRGGDLGRGGKIRVQITRTAATEMAEQCKVDARLVEPRDDDGTTVAVSESEMSIDLRLIDQPIRVPNVIGWLEGSDPELRDEYIVIGAHLDHLGLRDGKLFPGADDNASGSAAIVQIAKALHLNSVRPKRSVLFIAFAAEEIGLVGSKYYVKHPVKPLDKCICMLNIDMIGRNEEQGSERADENETSIHLVGTKQESPKLYETVLEANKYVGFDFEYDEERVASRSDQASFAEHGIPITFLFGGFNPHYHKTTDTLEGINFSKVANAARLNYACVFLAAEHGSYK